jgi:uncharacterized protein YoxC
MNQRSGRTNNYDNSQSDLELLSELNDLIDAVEIKSDKVASVTRIGVDANKEIKDINDSFEQAKKLMDQVSHGELKKLFNEKINVSFSYCKGRVGKENGRQ